MSQMQSDAKTLCPVCKKGRLSKNISSSFLGLIKRTYVECNNCKAAFLKIDEKYCLDEIKDTSYPNWQRYNHQVLTVREWTTIAQGGYSDLEQKQIDLDAWLQQLSNGAITIPTPINTNVVLGPNEQFIFGISDVIFSEPRAVRETSGSYGGPSIRVAKGMTWRLGRFKSKSESHEELRNIDTGTLTITSKRLVFSGAVKNISIELKKIVSIDPYEDGISLSKEGKERPAYFTNVDKQKITAAIQGRSYEIPMDGLILKVLIQKEIQ